MTDRKETTMDFTKIAELHLIGGAGGGDPKAGLCIMELVSWFDGAQKVTDRPECACPFLTAISININDRAPTQEDRNTLKPLLPLLAGTRDEASRKARAWFVMREGVLRILAARCDKIGKSALADAMRAATNPASMRAAVQEAHKTLRADADAHADAHAHAYAYAHSYAHAHAHAYAHADAHAHAHAHAYADAYANAHAYAYAEKRADILLSGRKWVFGIMREILTEAIKMGPHGALDVETYDTRAAELRDVLGLEPVA